MLLLNIDLREGLGEEFFGCGLIDLRSYRCRRSIEQLRETLGRKGSISLTCKVIEPFPATFIVEYFGEVFARGACSVKEVIDEIKGIGFGRLFYRRSYEGRTVAFDQTKELLPIGKKH
jgi:hypothetical protein